jgi:hypothetical protein
MEKTRQNSKEGFQYYSSNLDATMACACAATATSAKLIEHAPMIHEAARALNKKNSGGVKSCTRHWVRLEMTRKRKRKSYACLDGSELSVKDWQRDVNENCRHFLGWEQARPRGLAKRIGGAVRFVVFIVL